MRIKGVAVVVLFVFFLTAPLSCYAEANEEPKLSAVFRAGQTAFKQGSFKQALAAFLQVEKLGMDKPALFYNIGVCYYKLGLYDKAAMAFEITSRSDQMAPLAYYNLGLVALRQSDFDQARQWLDRAVQTAGRDKKLLTLARRALARVEERQRPPWLRYGSLGVGYDDNVSLQSDIASFQASGQEDTFTEVVGLMNGPVFGGTSNNGPQFQMNGYYLKYFDLSTYDIGAATLGLTYRKTFYPFKVEGGGSYTYSILDGKSFEQIPAFGLQVKRLWGDNLSVRFKYESGYVDMLDAGYDYLAGWRHRLALDTVWKSGKYRTNIGYVLELNDRENSDFSPTRHSLAAGFGMKITGEFECRAGISYRDSTYDMSVAPDRDEEQWISNARMVYSLGPRTEISGEFRHIRNCSNYGEYDYTRNVSMLSVATFF